MKIHFSLYRACWLFRPVDVSSSSITIETFLNSVWKTHLFKGMEKKKNTSSAVGWLAQCVWNERDTCVRVVNSQKSWLHVLVQIWKDTDTHVRDGCPGSPFAHRNTVGYTGLDCVVPSFSPGQWAMRVSAQVKRALNPLPPPVVTFSHPVTVAEVRSEGAAPLNTPHLVARARCVLRTQWERLKTIWHTQSGRDRDR